MTAWLKHSRGLDDEAMVEVVASVMHYVSFNTISTRCSSSRRRSRCRRPTSRSHRRLFDAEKLESGRLVPAGDPPEDHKGHLRRPLDAGRFELEAGPQAIAAVDLNLTVEPLEY